MVTSDVVILESVPDFSNGGSSRRMEEITRGFGTMRVYRISKRILYL